MMRLAHQAEPASPEYKGRRRSEADLGLLLIGSGGAIRMDSHSPSAFGAGKCGHYDSFMTKGRLYMTKRSHLGRRGGVGGVKDDPPVNLDFDAPRPLPNLL